MPLWADTRSVEQSSSDKGSQTCQVLASPQDVLDCALSLHPETQRAALANIQAENLESQARQRPNPELSGRSVFGSSLGDNVSNTELNLAHTIELGGKRGSRIEQAKAQQQVVAATSQRAREEVLLETIRNLYRYRQIRVEFHTIDEALDTFAKIQRQFRSRARRTPEQEVSLSVFSLAEGDYQLRKAALETELATVKRSLDLALNREFPASSVLLPPRRTQWPELREDEPPASFQGSAINSARAELKLASAELSLAQSLSWPNLLVGPAFETQVQGPFRFQTYGVNFSFEIPLFQINGGGRAIARRGLELAERGLGLRERELSTQRAILFQKYSNSVNALRKALSPSDIERKHQSTEAFFLRGIIPSSLVIEAHRQIVDFTKSNHEHELSAVEALWAIYVLEGRAFEEKL